MNKTNKIIQRLPFVQIFLFRIKIHKMRYIFEQILLKQDDKALAREIKNHYSCFSYLLEPTYCYVHGTPVPYYTTCDILIESWSSALNVKKVYSLHLLFCETMSKIADRDILMLLWSEYLQRFYRRFDNGVASIKINPSVKTYYINTIDLIDGNEYGIESHPWMYENEVIIEGMLNR